MATECSAPQLAFEGFEGRQVVGSFDGGAVTSNGGAVLLRQADLATRLTARVARCVRDRRNSDLVVHQVETLIAQRIHGLALGCEDLNDHDELRHDPVLGLVSDALEPKRADCATLAGKSTLNRLEHGLKGKASRHHKLEVGEAALGAGKVEGQELYERIYCARGEMENRIKECQLDLYADRTSAATMRANQIRLWFASLAYVLMEAVRRIGLSGAEMANATAGSIRLKLLKIGAVVTLSVRRIKIAFATACPAKALFVTAAERLCAAGPPIAIAA